MKRILYLIVVMLIPLAMLAQEQALVAYFSATGNTRAAAEKLAKEKNARLWEIEAAEPYTEADLNWRDKNSRSSKEMADPEERPMIRQCTNIMPYNDIYLGFPIWWGICPRIIQSWIDNNLEQLEGKRIFPFATSGSSGIEQAVEFLRQTYPTLSWQEGVLMNNR